MCRMEFEWNQYFWEGTQQWCVLLHLDFSMEFPSLNTLRGRGEKCPVSTEVGVGLGRGVCQIEGALCPTVDCAVMSVKPLLAIPA